MNFVTNVNRRHPELDKPLIDYDTALILEVTTLLGTVIGVDINKVPPVWVIPILMLLTLGFTTYWRSLVSPVWVSPVWVITILMILTLGFTTYRTGLKAHPTAPYPALELRRQESSRGSKELVDMGDEDKYSVADIEPIW
ncbi:hypothetical protein T484DRAFT_1830331 [Baffinella frigidus]|nr:hypothetical protein T484DRAFT_1830331 [Cryptophyta sp. CCMP2293]